MLLIDIYVYILKKSLKICESSCQKQQTLLNGGSENADIKYLAMIRSKIKSWIQIFCFPVQLVFLYCIPGQEAQIQNVFQW